MSRCYTYACRIAAVIDVDPSVPRVAGRQRHRANAESTTIEEHYRRNVGNPFLDHLIQGIDSRFDKYGEAILNMIGLVPSVIVARNDSSIDQLVELYHEDLPSSGKFNNLGYNKKPTGLICKGLCQKSNQTNCINLQKNTIKLSTSILKRNIYDLYSMLE